MIKQFNYSRKTVWDDREVIFQDLEGKFLIRYIEAIQKRVPDKEIYVVLMTENQLESVYEYLKTSSVKVLAPAHIARYVKELNKFYSAEDHVTKTQREF